jgi:hypothetical protein
MDAPPSSPPRAVVRRRALPAPRTAVHWALSLSYVRAHAVPVDAPVRDHRGRPIGTGLCGYPGLVDEAGLIAGRTRRRCHGCERVLAGKPLLP